MRRGRPGITLLELLVASVLGVIILLAIGRIDRVRENMRLDWKEAGKGRLSETNLSWMEVARQIEQADRLVLSNPASPSCQSGGGASSGECYQTLQLRIPIGANFETAAGYAWFQYSFRPATKEIHGYENAQAGCGAGVSFQNVSGMSLQFQDAVALAPPKEDAFAGPQDNNVVALTVTSTDATVSFSGIVVPRGIGYTNVRSACTGTGTAARCDSGLGLAPPGISSPPALCS